MFNKFQNNREKLNLKMKIKKIIFLLNTYIDFPRYDDTVSKTFKTYFFMLFIDIGNC